jgi:TATA-box binding protein (TBP) (component of TFIID and TFIIIB)
MGDSMRADYITREQFDSSQLPECLKVSTISLTFSMSTNVNFDAIAAHHELSKDGICSINHQGVCRTILEEGKKRKKQSKNNGTKEKKNFFNSITVNVGVGNERYIHSKIFNNGSVQMAGFIGIEEANKAVNTLTTLLSQPAVVDGVEVPYTQSPIVISKMKINLINVGFCMPYHIHRDTLNDILISKGVKCILEKCKHAGVRIKYLPEGKEKDIAIFVFEKGSVVITGSKNHHHILSGYAFITGIFEEHMAEIKKDEMDTLSCIRGSRFAHLIRGAGGLQLSTT